MKKITLFVITTLLASALSAEEPKRASSPVINAEQVPPAMPPATVDSLKSEIAYLRSFIKELELKLKYADIVCSQPDMLKAKQDTIEAAQKLQAPQVPKETAK